MGEMVWPGVVRAWPSCEANTVRPAFPTKQRPPTLTIQPHHGANQHLAPIPDNSKTNDKEKTCK